jgi:hypothetical protein
MRRKGPNEVRRFSDVAGQRYGEAMYLLRGDFTTGAVYLAGYAVECMPKALWLSRLPTRNQPAVIDKFHGAKAHDFGWLKAGYLETGGETFPPEISRAIARVNSWSTDLRYQPGAMRLNEAEAFLRAVDEILICARGRL